MSLRQSLNDLIKSQGYVTYQEVEVFCERGGYKISNAERRLRKSESPMIEAVLGKKKSGGTAIVGYKWVGLEGFGDNVPLSPIKPQISPNLASDSVSIGGLTWEQAKQRAVELKQQQFLAKL